MDRAMMSVSACSTPSPGFWWQRLRHRVVFEVVRHFIRAANVKLESGCAVKFLASALNLQRVARGTVGGKKLLGRLVRDEYGGPW